MFAGRTEMDGLLIFVFTTIAVNFICVGKQGQFSGINALITAQEGVQWWMDIGGWNREIELLDLV